MSSDDPQYQNYSDYSRPHSRRSSMGMVSIKENKKMDTKKTDIIKSGNGRRSNRRVEDRIGKGIDKLPESQNETSHDSNSGSPSRSRSRSRSRSHSRSRSGSPSDSNSHSQYTDDNEDLIDARLKDSGKGKGKSKSKSKNRSKSKGKGKKRGKNSKRGSLSLTQQEFGSDKERRKYMARRRWRKVRLFMKAQSGFSRRKTYSYVHKDGTVFWKIKLLYALPQFSLISLTMLINIQVLIYYNGIGVTLAFLSFFQIFARTFDVLTDPMMAYISDNLTRTRWGRRIPWMTIGAPFYAIAFFILMSPPTNTDDDGTNMAATYWFGASYLFFYLCDTVANIPLLALAPELSDDSQKRTDLFMWAKIFEGFGMIVGAGAPSILLLWFDKKTAFQLLAAIFGSWYVLSMYALITTVKERKQSLKQMKAPLVPAVMRSFRNIAFRPLVIAWILDFVALAMIVAVLPFFIAYYVESKDPDTLLSIAVVGFFVTSFSSIVVWRFIATRKQDISDENKRWYDAFRLGTRDAWLSFNLLSAITSFLFVLVDKHDDWLLAIFMTISGAPFGGQFLTLSVASDVIDYDEFLNYTRNEGAFTVFAQFIPKLAAIPAQSLPLIGLFMLGFKDPTADDEYPQQNGNVKIFLRLLFGVIPASIYLISYIIKRQYPITHEILDEISKGITLHMKGLPAMDPITKQEIIIEEYTIQEQSQVDLLDHFHHKQLIWLLEPNSIVKKYKKQKLSKLSKLNKKNGSKLSNKNNIHSDSSSDNNSNNNSRSSTKRLSFVVESPDELFGHNNNNNHSKQKNGLPNSNGINSPVGIGHDFDDFNSFRTNKRVRMVEDSVNHVIETKYYKSLGQKKGIQKIERRMLLLIVIGIMLLSIAGIGVASSIQYLNSKDYAFIPGLFCCGIGSSVVFTVFSIIRFRAAKELKFLIDMGGLEESLLKRVILPKIKGQRGGDTIRTTEEKDQIDALTGGIEENEEEALKHVKRLSQFKLFNSRGKKNRKNQRRSSSDVLRQRVQTVSFDSPPIAGHDEEFIVD